LIVLSWQSRQIKRAIQGAFHRGILEPPYVGCYQFGSAHGKLVDLQSIPRSSRRKEAQIVIPYHPT
jgi:hypothetical protein